MKFLRSRKYAPAYDFTTSMLWTVIAAAHILMHLGFAHLESGLCQQKYGKCFFQKCFYHFNWCLTYAFFGFNTHYRSDFNGWFS